MILYHIHRFFVLLLLITTNVGIWLLVTLKVPISNAAIYDIHQFIVRLLVICEGSTNVFGNEKSLTKS